VGQALLSDQSPLAERLARDWRSSFRPLLHELQRAGFATRSAVVALGRAGEAVRFPWCGSPVQFLGPRLQGARGAHLIAQATCSAISAGRSWFTGEQYFKRRADMGKLFAALPAGADNSVRSRRCNLEIELGKTACGLPTRRA